MQKDGAEEVFETDEYSDFEIKDVLLNLAEDGELMETRKLYPSFEEMQNFVKKISADYYGSTDKKSFKLNMKKKSKSVFGSNCCNQ